MAGLQRGSGSGSTRSPAKRDTGRRLRRRSPWKPALWSPKTEEESRFRSSVRLHRRSTIFAPDPNPCRTNARKTEWHTARGSPRPPRSGGSSPKVSSRSPVLTAGPHRSRRLRAYVLNSSLRGRGRAPQHCRELIRSGAATICGGSEGCGRSSEDATRSGGNVSSRRAVRTRTRSSYWGCTVKRPPGFVSPRGGRTYCRCPLPW